MAGPGPWVQVTFRIPEACADPVSAILQDFGSSGQELRPMPGTAGLEVVAYFEPDTPQAPLRSRLRPMLAAAAAEAGLETNRFDAGFRIEALPAADWTDGWRAHFRPVLVDDRICVCPPWDRQPDPRGGFTLVVEPKTAFGTGHHETTRLALRQMLAAVGPGQRVLDVGCGSGILSIAAVRLGAARVTAVDTDQDAVVNTRENGALNGVADRIHVSAGSAADVAGCYDLVVANIISSLLEPILPDIAERARPGGCVILGGLLASEAEGFRERVAHAGLRVAATEREGEWAGFVAVRPGGA